jgi:pilus assembly protein CpaF
MESTFAHMETLQSPIIPTRASEYVATEITIEKMDIDVTYGPISDFMKDPTVEEIWINSPERVFVARGGKSELTNLVLTHSDVKQLVDRILMWSGRRIDLSSPFVDAQLPDGSRLHVVIPEITAEHWCINIRKHLHRSLGLIDLANRGMMTAEISSLLSRSVKSGMNILVSGGTQSGKTTLLNALVSQSPVQERVITIEEVFELKPQLPDVVAMQVRTPNLQGDGEIPMRRLIKEALRMRPSRIIVGEVREAEALDLLIALNSGLPGMGTIHANSAKDAVIKLQTLPLLAGENISHKFIAPTVASALDLIVQVKLESDGNRRIHEVCWVTGRFEHDRAEIESLWMWNGSEYVRGIATDFPLENWWKG